MTALGSTTLTLANPGTHLPGYARENVTVGRPVGNRSSITHWLKGSQVTGPGVVQTGQPSHDTS